MIIQEQKVSYPQRPPVDCIVSGYEWICPICNKLNKEIEYGQIAKCNGCDAVVELALPEHCYG